MTEIETKIIEMIQANSHLSNELKKRYILAMFLMEPDKQSHYLELLQSFDKRCDDMNRGIFVVKPQEMSKVMRSYEEVKKDILKKLNNPNQ
jgi:hypothetical protein